MASFRQAAALLEFDPGENDVVLNVLSNLCMSLVGAGRDEEAHAVAADVLSRGPSPVVRNIGLRASMVASTFLGRLDEARDVARQAMSAWLADDMLPHMLSVFAWLAWLQGRHADAIRLDGAARFQVARMGLSNTPVFDRARSNLEQALREAVVPGEEALRRAGERLDREEIVGLCLG